MCEHKVTPVVFRWSRFVPKNNFPVHGTPLTTKIINSAQYYMKAVCFWMHVCIIRELSMYAEINNKQQTNSHFSGGVIVIVWAVNSSSKYLVSVSDDTWGLKGGISWGRRRGGWKKKKRSTCLCRSDTAYSVASWRAQSNASEPHLLCQPLCYLRRQFKWQWPIITLSRTTSVATFTIKSILLCTTFNELFNWNSVK